MKNSTDFDKDRYWTYRKLGAAEKRTVRELERKKLIVAVHDKPDWPAKPVGKKRAAAQRTRETRSMIASLNGEMFMMDHPVQRHAPVRKNCFYCQETNIYRDGVCAGHYEFLYKNMSNKQRMIEKAYHRDQRAQELQRKREEARKEREQVTA